MSNTKPLNVDERELLNTLLEKEKMFDLAVKKEKIVEVENNISKSKKKIVSLNSKLKTEKEILKSLRDELEELK